MEYMIRKATESDLTAISLLEEVCFSVPWSRKSLEDSFRNPLCSFLVAETDEKKVIGYIGIYLVQDEGQMTNVAVDPAFRHMGIGKDLLHHAADYCYEHGALTMLLEVRASNDTAFSLYGKEGFKVVGRRKNYYTNPTEDAILMTLTL